MSDNKQISPVAKFNEFLSRLKPQMALALPKHLNADRMARLALTAFSTNPALQQCSFDSIAASIMTAAQLGLEPNVGGSCYLIPYNGVCTFVPGWKGLIDLASRSGRSTIYTGVIFEDQVQGVDWDFIDGSRRELIIRRQSSLIDESKITHAYAIGWVKDAAMPVIELWSVEKLRNHRYRNAYKAYKDRMSIEQWEQTESKRGMKAHYSFRYFEAYCRKIVLLQVLKYMPRSIELIMALDVTQKTEFGGMSNIIDGVVVSEPSVNDDLQVDTQTGEVLNDKYKDLRIAMNDAQTIDELDALNESVKPLERGKVKKDYDRNVRRLEGKDA
jgi:recombination protein RecT